MICYLIALCILVLWKAKFTSYNDGYIGIEQSTSIKGIFIIIVFLSHANGYLDLIGKDVFEWLYVLFFSMLGQLMVAMFLFYSGYGILENIKNKGNMYWKGYFKNRVLKTLLNFDIAILLYAVLGILLNTKCTAGEFLLSLVGWESLGNSNWYIFDILVLYIIAYIAFKVAAWITKNHTIGYLYCGVFIIFIFSCIFITALLFLKGKYQTWWFNTVLCFTAGGLYSETEQKIRYKAVYTEPDTDKLYVIL